MIQTEAERQFYLGAAGIRLWYSRDPLPGAAASPEFDFTEEQPADSAGPTAEVLPGQPGPKAKSAPSPSGQGRVANLQALMDTPAPAAEEANSKSKPAAKAPAADAVSDVESTEEVRSASEAVEQIPVLDLQLWIGERYSVIASLSQEASLRLQETLAANILRSLGEAGPKAVGPIHWPVFNNLKAPGNSLADLKAVLSHVLSGLGDSRLISLGITAPMGFEAEGDDRDAHWLHYLSGTSPQVSFPHGLAELSTNPTLKRALWQELKPLAGQ